MPLLQLCDLDKYYGAVPILCDASLVIQPGEKWGLIGKNGSGKTTLLKILCGEEDYDRGEIHWVQNCRIGYLKQDPDLKCDCSVYEELRKIFCDLDEIQAKLNAMQQQMSDLTAESVLLNDLVNEYHLLQEQFEQAGGYQIEGRIQGVLRGLGLPKERWNDQAVVLSGGERTRLALAKILLTANDLLFLDEPTNYLDISAIEWLEGFLADFKGAVLLISHDRFFLDRVVSGIFEIELHKIHRYRGNYTEFRRQKEAVFQTNLKAFQQQEKEIQRQEKFIREARSTEKSKRQAQSIEKRLDKVERIEKPLQDNKTIKFKFEERVPSSRQVLEIENLSKSFGTKVLLNEVNLKLEYGEKVGLIGPNGTGKTTFLKMVLGMEQPGKGRIRLGYEVYPGYFSQLEKAEDLSGTPFSQVMSAADLDNTEARTLLGRFLFRGDDVFKEMVDLSGGERRRLGLIKLMLSKANFLILDEPTNHLDLDSIEVVEQALTQYPGTVLIVSHDRYFLNKLANRYIALENGRFYSFTSYQDYLDWRSLGLNQPEEADKPKNEAQVRREQTKDQQREVKRKQRSLNELETDIDKLEARKQELNKLLACPEVHTDYQKSLELSEELGELERKLGDCYQQWEELQHELNELLV